MYILPVLGFPLVVAVSLASATAVPPAPNCQNLTLEVSATATNSILKNPPNPNNASAIHAYYLAAIAGADTIAGTHDVSETFVVQAVYCEPRGIANPSKIPLQFLVHGGGYNHAVWGGYGYNGQQYSWHAHATNAGFRTLAVDIIGRSGYPEQKDPKHPGRLIFPDPFSVIQAPLQVAVMQQVIRNVRQGHYAAVPAPQHLIYIGHSYGSLLGPLVSPGVAIDAMILTGYSDTINPDPTVPDSITPAVEVNPTRFAHLPPGYLSIGSEEIHTSYFYNPGGYDPNLAHLDWVRADVNAIGETLVGPKLVTSNYTGPLLVAAGEHDRAFCAGPGTCQETLADTHSLFPSVTDYSYFVAPNSGHLLMLHYSASKTFAFANSWINARFPARGH